MIQVSNKEISQKLSAKRIKHDVLENVINAISSLVTRKEEINNWNNMSEKEKNDYFHACQNVLYKQERVENYKKAFHFDDYEDLQVFLGGKSLEDAGYSSSGIKNLNTAISLAHQAKDAREELSRFKKEIVLDMNLITQRAVQFLDFRDNGKLTGKWS